LARENGEGAAMGQSQSPLQSQAFCGCGNRPPGPAGPQHEVLPLHSLELGQFDDGDLAEANEALLDAVALGRKGKHSEAYQRLLSAEQLLERAAPSPAMGQLRRACYTDPELQEIRITTPLKKKPKDKKEPKTPKSKKEKKDKKSRTGDDADSLVCVEAEGQLADLEKSMSDLRHHCSGAYVFEAHAVLMKIERTAKAAAKYCKGSDSEMAALRAFSDRLASDPLIGKLRVVHPRMEEALAIARSASCDGYTPVVIKDPDFGKHFRLELTLRPLTKAEWEAGGPRTQLMCYVRIFNWPLSLLRTIAVDTEADNFNNNWIKDCRGRDVQNGGLADIFSNLIVLTIALSPLPITLEDVQIREFATFDTPPLKGARPGVLVVEKAPPVDGGRFENWDVPNAPTRTGCYRISGGTKVHYKMSSTEVPNCTDLLSFSKFGLPVPSFLLPVDTFKNILASKIQESLKLMYAGGLVDRWPETGYEERMGPSAPNASFYKAVEAVMRASAPPKQAP